MLASVHPSSDAFMFPLNPPLSETFVEPFARKTEGQVKIGAEGLPLRKGQFSGQDLLIDDLLALTNKHWKVFSFDNHRFAVKENNGISATFWTLLEDSDKYLDELLHFMFPSCHIFIPQPVNICLKWVGCILSLVSKECFLFSLCRYPASSYC